MLAVAHHFIEKVFSLLLTNNEGIWQSGVSISFQMFSISSFPLVEIFYKETLQYILEKRGDFSFPVVRLIQLLNIHLLHICPSIELSVVMALFKRH